MFAFYITDRKRGITVVASKFTTEDNTMQHINSIIIAYVEIEESVEELSNYADDTSFLVTVTLLQTVLRKLWVKPAYGFQKNCQYCAKVVIFHTHFQPQKICLLQ